MDPSIALLIVVGAIFLGLATFLFIRRPVKDGSAQATPQVKDTVAETAVTRPSPKQDRPAQKRRRNAPAASKAADNSLSDLANPLNIASPLHPIHHADPAPRSASPKPSVAPCPSPERDSSPSYDSGSSSSGGSSFGGGCSGGGSFD